MGFNICLEDGTDGSQLQLKVKDENILQIKVCSLIMQSTAV